METILPWFYWLFPVAFALHNAEEAVFLPLWSQTAGTYHKPVGRFEFRFAVATLTTLGFAVTALFFLRPRGVFFCYFFFVFNLGMLINVVYPHIVAPVAMRRYAPGLATGLALVLPVTLLILVHGYTHRLFELRKLFFYAVPIATGVVGSIPLLFKLGRRLEGRLA